MTNGSEAETGDDTKRSLKETLRIENLTRALLTIIFGIIGAGIFALVYAIPMPYTMISLLKLSLSPALAIITVIGAIRGPIAGFLSGYLGLLIHDFVFFNTIVDLTLPALSYGVLGLIVGIASYDFQKGRSLAKLSILSTIGLVFTALLSAVFGLVIFNQSILLVLGFVMLPLFTVGIPSVILFTPIYAKSWQVVSTRVSLPWLENKI